MVSASGNTDAERAADDWRKRQERKERRERREAKSAAFGFVASLWAGVMDGLVGAGAMSAPETNDPANEATETAESSLPANDDAPPEAKPAPPTAKRQPPNFPSMETALTAGRHGSLPPRVRRGDETAQKEAADSPEKEQGG